MMGPKELAALMLGQYSEGDTVEQAVQEGRCIKPSLGCGKPIGLRRDPETLRRVAAYDFPTEAHAREWQLNGLCASCQERATLLDQEDDSNIVRGMD